MVNKKIIYSFICASLFLCINYNAYSMVTTKHIPTIRGSHPLRFPPFKPLKNNEQEKKEYITKYYDAWYERLQQAALNPNDSNQESLLSLTGEAYSHLCQDPNINITPDAFWKSLRIKTQMQERQNGQTEKNIQVKTPLMDIFTSIENTIKQIIPNNEELIIHLTQKTKQQNAYNDTIEPDITPEDFAQLPLILPYSIGYEFALDQTADFLTTNILYYINKNAEQKAAVMEYTKATLELNNRTAKNLQLAEELNPNKKNIQTKEKSQIFLDQLTKLKEKNNVQN